MNELDNQTCASCRWHVSWYFLGIVIAAAIFSSAVIFQLFAQEPKAKVIPTTTAKPAAVANPLAPELTKISSWINSQPLELKQLRGQVVVLHFWTAGCINCVRNLPYYNRWQQDYAKEKLTIIGVHTPEFEHEEKLANLQAAIDKHQLRFPIAIDNEHATWNAYQNRYWPAVYVIDKQGNIRQRWEGELEHNNAGGDQQLRQKINELLAE